MACDGIFDKLSSKDVIKEVWTSCKRFQYPNIHKMAGGVVEEILYKAMISKSYDNVTVVIIGLESFTTKLFPNTITNKQVQNKKQIANKKQASNKKTAAQKITKKTSNNDSRCQKR